MDETSKLDKAIRDRHMKTRVLMQLMKPGFLDRLRESLESDNIVEDWEPVKAPTSHFLKRGNCLMRGFHRNTDRSQAT